MIKIKFNDKEIALHYSSSSIYLDNNEFFETHISGESSIIISSDKQSRDAYECANQEAHLYLLKNAIDEESPTNKLKKIIILQNINCFPSNGNIKLEIILEGLAVFERKK